MGHYRHGQREMKAELYNAPAGKGSFALSILPLLRSRISRARCNALSSTVVSDGERNVMPGVSMRWIDIPSASRVTPAGTSVVDGPRNVDDAL